MNRAKRTVRYQCTYLNPFAFTCYCSTSLLHSKILPFLAMLLSIVQKAAFFCLLTAVQYCHSLPTNDSVLLKPLHPPQYGGPFRLQSRDSNQYSKLDLQDKGQLMYGGARGMWALKVEGRIKRQCELTSLRKWKPHYRKHDALRARWTVDGLTRALRPYDLCHRLPRR